MSTPETSTSPTASPAPASKAPVAAVAPSPGLRRKKRAEGRKKRATKLATNKEFAKQYFEGKSKRSTEKKSAFRKKKSKKK